MFKQNNVLVTGTDRMKIFEIVALFESQNKYQLQTKVITAEKYDLLSSLSDQPSIMVLILDSNWKKILDHLSAIPKKDRPEVILIADEYYSDVMQTAMRIGVSDYISIDQAADTLLPALERIASEVSSLNGKTSGKLITVINSKGGSGSSFIAANIAHILSVTKNKKVALIDLDLTFAPIAVYFDIKNHNNLSDALQIDSGDMDHMALKGYMSVHESGVHVLANIPGHMPISWATPTVNIDHLIELVLSQFDYVIVDMPSFLEPYKQAVLEYSDKVLLVVQQSIMHLRDGKLLKQMIERECSVNSDRIIPVVNRFNKSSDVSLKHVEKALQLKSPLLIPNDFSLVTKSIESGALVYEINSKAKITKALINIVNHFEGSDIKQKSFFEGLFSRAKT